VINLLIKFVVNFPADGDFALARDRVAGRARADGVFADDETKTLPSLG